MNRILPIILIAASIWVVLGFIRPQFSKIEITKNLIEERTQTLADAERVIERRDEIMAQYASISDEQVVRLKQLLPDRADGVRGVIELSSLASAYGLVLTDIEISSQSSAPRFGAQVGGGAELVGPDGLPLPSYVVSPMNISFKGTYEAFVAFLFDLEHSLRLADLKTLDIDARSNSENENEYKYDLVLDFYEYVL